MRKSSWFLVTVLSVPLAAACGSDSGSNDNTGGNGGGAGAAGTTMGGAGTAGSNQKKDAAPSGSTDAGTDAQASGDTQPAAIDPKSYLPLTVGSKWTYEVEDTTTKITYEKDNFVEAMAKVGGGGTNKSKDAVRVVTIKREMKAGVLVMDRTESYQALEGSRFVRYREVTFSDKDNKVATGEEVYDPSRLRLDVTAARLIPGTEWKETYAQNATVGTTVTPSSHTEDWVIEKVDEMRTVPAGTFNCIKVTKKTTKGTDTKSWWYAPGVGKVLEEGGQTERLKSYTIAKP